MTKIDVCICTHNPKTELFQLILTAIANQTFDKQAYKVSIVDNGSCPAINEADLQVLATAGINYQLLAEPTLGVIWARLKSIESTDSDLVVFVDDDNELMLDYLEKVWEIATAHPEIGCFGGKLRLGGSPVYPRWIDEMLPFLAIKDIGDREVSNCVSYWGEWEPPGAGSVVRRSVLELFAARYPSPTSTMTLGRQGNSGLLSAEDSLIARGAYQLGLYCSYQPKLQLIHHIDPSRLEFSYLIRLLYNYGRSYVLLETILEQPIAKMNLLDRAFFLIRRLGVRAKETKSIPQFLCMLAWDLGYLKEIDNSSSNSSS
jgi:glycosyltransferase involved in cell wall biosynthesis